MALLLAGYLGTWGLLALTRRIPAAGHLVLAALLVAVLWQPLPAPVASASDTPPAPQPEPVAEVPAPPPAQDRAGIQARYGSQLYGSLEEMPDDLRHYYTGTVQQVADFFNVRPGDILGILRAENNDAGYRVAQPSTSSAGAKGVAQVVVRTWNGWSNPHTTSHLTDMQSIVAHGGLGFDWERRDAWRAWKDSGDASGLAGSHADPNQFEDGVAAIGLHLYRYDLTRDLAASDPERFRTILADSIAIYNSGKPLSESASWTQSAANRKTVAQYVAGAIAVGDATPLQIAWTPPAPEVAPPLPPAAPEPDPPPADEAQGCCSARPTTGRTIKAYGVRVAYQTGGIHTGVDLTGEAVLAAGDGTVIHVGGLYCIQAGKCRGPHAVVIDHGGNVFTTYSHNRAAHVSPGQHVSAGTHIADVGNEGYSMGPHLHFEVIEGCQWSGDWTDPWRGADCFKNPEEYLP